MNLRKPTFLALTAVFALTLASCGTMRRAGKDAGVVLFSPIIIPYGGFTDGFNGAQGVRKGLDGTGATEVLALPFTTTYHLVKHTLWAVIHLVDFVVFPIYGAAELHPNGPEIEPLDSYTGTIFDSNSAKATDPESGETEK